MAEIQGAADGGDLQDTAWIEVIQKMEEVYSDLIRYEVDLEKKNAELQDAQRFIESVQASMSDVLIVCDEQGAIQSVNRAFRAVTGFDDAELTGLPVDQVMENGAPSPLPTPGHAAPREIELRLRAKDGRLTDVVTMNASVRLDQRGRPAGTVLTGRPVGELRRAYAALERAHAELKQAQQTLVRQEKMASLGRLVAGVAHELNNPISFVYGNVHTMERYCRRLTTYLEAIHDGASPEDVAALRRSLKIDKILGDMESMVEGTLEGAQRVSDIVKNLRRLSFPKDTATERVDLAPIARTAAGWAERGRPSGVTLTFDLPEPLMVDAVSGQLHQVVVNLVENALDACAPDGRVTLSGRVEDDRAVLEVTDTGPGIAEENLLRIFDPFFTTKEVGQGTGLGLWISYGIARDHGGTLEAETVPEGGTVFRLTLPAAS